MKNAREAQVEPNDYMRAAFPDLSEDGQHSGDHQMAIVKAPRDAIYNWMNKIPVTPLGAGDNDLKTTPSSVLNLGSPPKWESLSNFAGDFDAKLIRKYTGPRGPRGETPESRSELEDVDDIEAREEALRRHRQKQAALTEHIKRVAGHLLSESDAKV